MPSFNSFLASSHLPKFRVTVALRSARMAFSSRLSLSQVGFWDTSSLHVRHVRDSRSCDSSMRLKPLAKKINSSAGDTPTASMKGIFHSVARASHLLIFRTTKISKGNCLAMNFFLPACFGAVRRYLVACSACFLAASTSLDLHLRYSST